MTKIACSWLARNDFPFTFFTSACQFEFEWARLLWQGEQWSIGVNYGVCVLGKIGPFLPRILPLVSQICEIWINNNNHKIVPILANFCCLEANLVSNCRKKEFSKCSYNLLGHKIISFYFIGRKIGVPFIFLFFILFYYLFIYLFLKPLLRKPAYSIKQLHIMWAQTGLNIYMWFDFIQEQS